MLDLKRFLNKLEKLDLESCTVVGCPARIYRAKDFVVLYYYYSECISTRSIS